MNYTNLYSRLITHARQSPPQGYFESHHVIPRCMGGNDSEDNLVDLTARQHFIAHWLLTKMHPNVSGLWYAFHMMFYPTSANTRQEDWVQSRSRVYERNKHRMGQLVGNRMRGVPKTTEQRSKMRQSALRRWQNLDARKAQSVKMIGNTNGKGVPRPEFMTDSVRENISSALKSHWATHPHPRRGRPLSPESIAKMKETKRLHPRVWTEEDRQRLSVVMKGRRQPPSQREAVRVANSRTWDVTLPSGERLVVTNLRQFCQLHGLNQSNLSTHGHTKGYTATRCDTP